MTAVLLSNTKCILAYLATYSISMAIGILAKKSISFNINKLMTQSNSSYRTIYNSKNLTHSG